VCECQIVNEIDGRDVCDDRMPSETKRLLTLCPAPT